MRKRLKVMRELLQAAARHSMESEVAHKVFKEYFSFEWEDTLSLNISEEELDTAAEVS